MTNNTRQNINILDRSVISTHQRQRNSQSVKSVPKRKKQFGVRNGEVVYLTEDQTIPRNALKQTIDNTHEIFKAWKKDQTMT